MKHVMRHGKRIAVETVDTAAKPRRKFAARFVQVPYQWVAALRRSRSAGSTYALALAILAEAHRQKSYGRGDDITLSKEVTSLPRNTKVRAAKELAELGLIVIEQNGNQAVRVIELLL
jgi:hypothetical protein